MNQLVVTHEASEAKQGVGATAWVVFEHLVLEAGDDLESLATARSVAVAVSVSKDTAAAAIRRLEVAGLVERRAQARDVGRFGARGLRLRLPAGVTVSIQEVAPDPGASKPSSRPDEIADRPADPVEQLSLLDPAGHVDAPTHRSTETVRRAVHEFASSDAGPACERDREHAGGSSC